MRPARMTTKPESPTLAATSDCVSWLSCITTAVALPGTLVRICAAWSAPWGPGPGGRGACRVRE
eukprot:356593-Chlamydomonas_euryale.AAC.1